MRISYSIRRPRPRSISGAALALAGLVATAQAALAGGAPDWMVQAARQPLPNYPKDTVAVAIYSEQQTTVKDNGEIETRYREVYKILRPEGSGYGTVQVSYSKDTPLTYLKAWCLPAVGKPYEVKEKDAIEQSITDEGEIYGDIREKTLEIPAADPGNVVGYEYVQKGRPFVFQDDWSFQEPIPVLQAQYTLQIPAGWKYETYWVNYKGPPPQSPSPNEYVWQLANLPPVIVEHEMPPWRAVAGRMDVKYYSPQNLPEAEQAVSWRDLGAWYNALAAPSRVATPEIKQEVAQLTAHAKTPLEQIEALTAYVQRQIRYVAIEIGIGGVQPHPAAEVLQNQFGDCKDKATLLMTMLHEIGVDSYYVVVQSDRGIVQPAFPSATSFNHVTVAIRLPDGVPTTTLYAVVNDPKLGKLLFFDPTDPYTPLGYLPDTEQDNYVLLVAPDGGKLVHLPLLPPPTNRLLRTAQFDLSPDGNLTGRVEEIRWGGPADSERAAFLETVPAERNKIFENFLGVFLDDFHLESAALSNLHKFNDSLVMNYSFTAANYAKQVGNLLVVRPRVVGEKGWSLLEGKPRKYPVEFPEATVQTDDFRFTLPAGFVADELPPPVKVDCGYIAYQSDVSIEGNVLHYKRMYEVKNVIVPRPKLGELKTALGEIAADERSSVILRRAMSFFLGPASLARQAEHPCVWMTEAGNRPPR